MKDKEIYSCNGKNCKIRLICQKYHNWMEDDDEENQLELAPGFVNDQCVNFNQIEFYGG